MKQLNDIKQIYFIGIGGIGMSALARFFNARGVKVFGYDKTETVLCKTLVAEGISITYNDDEASLNKNVDLVVYTPAIPKDSVQLNWYQQNNFEVIKRSDMLQIISKSMKALCVAGTHGKTTVSTMLAYLLQATNYGCNAFLGGISVNYNSNYWSSPNEVAVIEADEYDRSFLKLFPACSILTAMDADHLDIYGTAEEMEKTYLQYVNNVSDILIYKHGVKHSSEFTTLKKYSYSLQNDASDFYAKDIVMHNGTYSFVFMHNEKELAAMQLNIGGMHNVENAIAACAMAYLQNIKVDSIAEALKGFKGVKRRFEYIVKNDQNIYIDDYAHHPEELNALIKSAKALFKNKKCTVLFQPHLYTRTRDFADGFAESLSLADEVILLEIYPARELPIEGVTSQMIKEKMSLQNVTILSKQGALEFVKSAPLQVLITAGAGDIDQLIEPIKNILNSKSND